MDFSGQPVNWADTDSVQALMHSADNRGNRVNSYKRKKADIMKSFGHSSHTYTLRMATRHMKAAVFKRATVSLS